MLLLEILNVVIVLLGLVAAGFSFFLIANHFAIMAIVMVLCRSLVHTNCRQVCFSLWGALVGMFGWAIESFRWKSNMRMLYTIMIFLLLIFCAGWLSGFFERKVEKTF